MRLSTLGLALILTAFFTFTDVATAQITRSTAVPAGGTVDIDVHGDCKRVTYDGWGGAAGVVAPWDTHAEWQSFYNNPPAGVTIASCAASCPGGGYSYGGYCYYHTGTVVQTCDALCVNYGGANQSGTRYIGSDDSSGARCSAVASALAGSAVTAAATTGLADGCILTNYKGGWSATNYYSPTTVTNTASNAGRICACGGSDTCAGPYSIPGANRTYTATTLASNTFTLSQNANISVSGQTGACNPQPTYNHPHYVQVRRTSDGAIMAQGNNGGYTWQGACWTQTSSSTSVTVGPGTYEVRLVSQQNCNDSSRCSWGYSASMSCFGGTLANCNLPWGGQIAHGQSVTAYSESSGSCPSQTRTCNNGTLSGSYGYSSCTVTNYYCGSSYMCGSYWIEDVYCSGGQSCGSYGQFDDCGWGPEYSTYYYCY